MQTEDKYPSRIDGIPKILPRVEPVVYGSVADGPLSREQMKEYDQNGFLFLKSFYSPKEVALMRHELDELRNSEEIRQSELAITEPQSGETRSVFAVQTVSELFEQLSCDSRILSILQQILATDVYIHQSRVNFKPGFRGKEFYWHSDFETWHAEDGMPEMRAISCSVTLTDNEEFNGPLMLIPGSHKLFCQSIGQTPGNHYQQSLKRQEYGVPTDEQLAWLVDEYGIAVPKGPAGSVLLFECNVMHGSGSNISPYPRSNAFFVYNSVKNALQEPFAAAGHRPWFLGNREPEALEPVNFKQILRDELVYA